MTPEFYLFIGIVGTSFIAFLGYMAWDAMKSYVQNHVGDIQHEMEREIYRDMDQRSDEIYRRIEEIDNDNKV